VKINDRRIHGKIKYKIQKRLSSRRKKEQADKPVFSANTSNYELSDRIEAMHCGGIGAIHNMVKAVGLDRELDKELKLLKQHQPYHESDHVLNIVYNIIAGGSCIEDIELLRKDPAYMNALGASRIPDPTTVGDFLRRFKVKDINALMRLINKIRPKIWSLQSEVFKKRATLYIDSTVAETSGEHKQGMNMAYTGQWGYHLLLISLGETREPLYIENREGNAYTSRNAIGWMDKSIELVKKNFREVWLGGDTGFYLSSSFDRWDKQGVNFVFGCKNYSTLRELVEEAPWKRLKRPAAYSIKTFPRRKKHNAKNRAIKDREFKQLTLEKEYVTEIQYRPTNCEKSYRLVAVKKIIRVTKGQLELFDQERYFFYITNDWEISTAEVVYRSNDRCDHENDIDQLKNGVHAMRMPGHDLISNWAYTVIASLAWTLKSWMGLLMPHKGTGYKIVRMEFKRFLNSFINIPAQMLKRGGQILLRLVGYMEHAPPFFGFLERLGHLRL
jgi:hypothetical protein